jgi:small-conductance mechanosensitive channel
VRCDLLEQIKTHFDEAGISIPYPQQEIAIRGQNGLGNQ